MPQATGYDTGSFSQSHVRAFTELGGVPATLTPIPFWPPSPEDSDFSFLEANHQHPTPPKLSARFFPQSGSSQIWSHRKPRLLTFCQWPGALLQLAPVRGRGNLEALQVGMSSVPLLQRQGSPPDQNGHTL